MACLPIVIRELRAAARRKGSRRIRLLTAIAAIGACFVFQLGSLVVGVPHERAGRALFTVLTTCAFGLCLLSGIFLTAGSVSEEKREGTLGLLFLSNLTGLEIVLGKLFARSLPAVYGLLALLPAMALPLLLGGVTGGEFWRMALALASTLFLSLAAGMWMSVRSSDSQPAISGTLGLLALLVGFPWLAQLVPVAWRFGTLSVFSPFMLFQDAVQPISTSPKLDYWPAFVAQNSLAWLFLAIAGRALSHGWRVSEGIVAASQQSARAFAVKSGALTRRRHNPGASPIFWLLSRLPRLGRAAWMVVVIWALIAVLVTSWAPSRAGNFFGLWYEVGPFALLFNSSVGLPSGMLILNFGTFGLVLKCLVAGQACRFFAEARRTGELELLLSTPLTNQDLIRGQFQALRRTFLWPVVCFLLIPLIPLAIQLFRSFVDLLPEGILGGGVGLVLLGVGAARVVAELYAIAWLGLWLALSLKKPRLAPGLTILCVTILPAFLCWMDVLTDLFFILWGATRLQGDLRRVLNR